MLEVSAPEKKTEILDRLSEKLEWEGGCGQVGGVLEVSGRAFDEQQI